MLALARCYLSDPKVILLDEVSIGLAPKIVDEIFTALRELAVSGVALLVVEQYITKALDLADQVVLLDRGGVNFTGTTAELEQAEVLRTYFGTDGRESSAPADS
jgi:branched-chain amino acid transport system ATP-binding protein